MLQNFSSAAVVIGALRVKIVIITSSKQAFSDSVDFHNHSNPYEQQKYN